MWSGESGLSHNGGIIMNEKEVLHYMKERTPMEYQGIKYAYISAFILRLGPKNEKYYSVELWDYCNHSVTTAPIASVHPVIEG